MFAGAMGLVHWINDARRRIVGALHLSKHADLWTFGPLDLWTFGPWTLDLGPEGGDGDMYMK